MNVELDDVVVWVFWIFLSIAIVVALYKRCITGSAIPNDLKTILVRFFACQCSIFFVFHLQVPYKYQLYLEKGLKHSEIAEIFGYANIFVAIWNIIMPLLLKKLGHATLCVFVTLIYCFNSVILAFTNKYLLFVIAGCLQGIAMPTSMMALMDYWMTEELLLPPEYNSNYIFNEFRVMSSLLVSSVTSPISQKIVKTYGIEAIYSFGITTPLCAIVLIVYLLHLQQKPEEKTLIGDFSDLKLFFTEKPANIIIVMVDIAFAMAINLLSHHMAAILFTSSHKPPMGYVQGSFGVLDLIAAQIFSQVSDSLPVTLWAVLFLLVASCAMILIYLHYENKIAVFMLLSLSSAVISASQGIFIQLRKMFYPGRIRNYIMTTVKLPTAFLCFIIVWFSKNYAVQAYVIWTAMVLGWGALFAIFLYNHSVKEKSQDESNLLEDNTDSENPEVGSINNEILNIEVSDDEQNIENKTEDVENKTE